MTWSSEPPSLSSPVPRRIDRSIFSFGMLLSRARSTARRKAKFASGSPPPSLAAMLISRANRVKTLPRRASLAAFLRFMVDHLECPDMRHPLLFERRGIQARVYIRIQGFQFELYHRDMSADTTIS